MARCPNWADGRCRRAALWSGRLRFAAGSARLGSGEVSPSYFGRALAATPSLLPAIWVWPLPYTCSNEVILPKQDTQLQMSPADCTVAASSCYCQDMMREAVRDSPCAVLKA